MKKLALLFFAAACMVTGSIVHAEEAGGGDMTSVFDTVAREAALKNGVKEITYDQFMNIRKSGEKYVLLDVLLSDSYAKGHIEGAASFPVTTIDEGTASGRLNKGDKIVVYCGSFQCGASTQSAQALTALGYTVLDYKGGLKEWQKKGNALSR